MKYENSEAWLREKKTKEGKNSPKNKKKTYISNYSLTKIDISLEEWSADNSFSEKKNLIFNRFLFYTQRLKK